VMIGGIIVGPTGAANSNILLRAIGPSLSNFGIQNALADPMLELHNGDGALVRSNNNWRDTQQTEIEATGIQPQNNSESAILASLAPGAYTAIVAGNGGGTGVGVVEAYRVAVAGTATLIVRTFLPSDVAANGISGPGPAGTSIFINGSESGTTQADGTATLQVPAGTLQVAAELHPSNAGQTSVTLVSGETKQVDVIMAEGKELSEDSTLKIDQLAGSILDRNFTSLTLRFLKPDASTVALRSLDFVTLDDAQGGNYALVTQFFALQPDGTVVLNNVASFRNLLLSRSGKILINVHGEDASGGVHDSTAEFFVSAYRILGNLAAPPSNPSLNTTGILITGSILNTDLVFEVVSDANSHFEFPLLPAGNFEFTSQTQQNGVYYYGQGTLVLDGNKTLHINMLATEDLINGVPPFTVDDAVPLSAERRLRNIGSGTVSAAADRQAIAAAKMFHTSPFAPGLVTPAGSITPVSVNVAADQENTPVTQTATLNLPQGTQTIDLTYSVQTDEYPEYVLQQSIYNDTWSLSVRGGASGQEIFSIGRQVNSQLTAPPVWQSSGSTGVIKHTLNVANLAISGPTTLILFASAMNVGDSILPTRVSATLGPDATVKINKATPDSTVPDYKGKPRPVLNFHSIPRTGSTNVFDRFFTLDISKPHNSTVKKVTVTLLGPGPLMTVVDEAPGHGSVEEIDEHTLRVRVSIKTTASTVAGQPPPTHQLKYRFKLVVTVDGNDVSDEKESGERLGLWRMPDGFPRFSTREDGGDNWCSRGTYNWLVANGGLMTKINDISGEHGRDLGHASHKHGTDIDIFHFYTFPGAESGGQNYAKLVEDVKVAIDTGSAGQAAKQRVKGWVTATHSGLDALAAKAAVIELRYARGWGFGPKHQNEIGLSAGWARELLTTGRTTVNGTPLVLDTGNWTNTNNRYIPVNDHNDHLHITLSRSVLQE
jgi:hypothetical protein